MTEIWTDIADDRDGSYFVDTYFRDTYFGDTYFGDPYLETPILTFLTVGTSPLYSQTTYEGIQFSVWNLCSKHVVDSSLKEMTAPLANEWFVFWNLETWISAPLTK